MEIRCITLQKELSILQDEVKDVNSLQEMAKTFGSLSALLLM